MDTVYILKDDNYFHLIGIYLPVLHHYLERNNLLNKNIPIYYKGKYTDILKKYSNNIIHEEPLDDSYIVNYHWRSMTSELNKKVKNVLMKDFVPQKKDGAIFIKRHNRKIKNEKDVLNIFKNKFNTEIEEIDFSEMSFEEQMKKSNSSDLLIGVHGAGLTNLMFMQPDAKIFEIDPFDWVFCCDCNETHGGYGHLAKILDMRGYQRIHQPTYTDRDIESFEVDLEDLEKKLNSVE